jgi:hypothetical protein
MERHRVRTAFPVDGLAISIWFAVTIVMEDQPKSGPIVL